MKYEIKELSVTQILDQAFKVIGDNFGTLAGIVCLLTVPIGIVQAVLQPAQQDPFAAEPVVVQVDQTQLVAFFAVTVVAAIAGFLTNAAIVHAISDAYLGNKPSIGKSFGRAANRFFPLVGTWILLVLAIAGGLLLFIIPGILCMLWFALATQVTVLEPKAGASAMSRSKELMKGNITKLIGLGLLLFVISIGVIIGVGAVAAISQNALAVNIISVFANAVNTLIGSAAIVLFYFSARCQHENFDLTLLADSIAGPSTSNTDAVDDDEDGRVNKDSFDV